MLSWLILREPRPSSESLPAALRGLRPCDQFPGNKAEKMVHTEGQKGRSRAIGMAAAMAYQLAVSAAQETNGGGTYRDAALGRSSSRRAGLFPLTLDSVGLGD